MLADELLDRRSKNFEEMEHSLGLKGLLFQENSNSKSGADFAISLSPSVLIIIFRGSFCQRFLETSRSMCSRCIDELWKEGTAQAQEYIFPL